MSAYRLYPSNPAVTLVSYGGSFLAGVCFEVTASPAWLQGFWWYVPAGGDTTAQKFALWSATSSGSGVVISAATVTSGALTAGQWNFVSLAAPVQLAAGTPYVAATGWTAVHGFPSSNNQFGSGQPFSAGIVNGPLTAFSDTSGTLPAPYGMPQGVFSVAASDPTVHMPNQGSNSANFGMDVQVTTTPPASWPGTYRLWPNKWDSNPQTAGDALVPYTIGTEIQVSHLYQYATLVNAWYYSPSGSSVLASRADVWNIATGLSVASITSPSWSGAAGSGWLSAPFAGGLHLPPGKYRMSVYAASGGSGSWAAKDASTDYWGETLTTGYGANGITWGPLYAPPQPLASSGFVYNGSDGGATPNYSSGTATPAQSVFGQTTSGSEVFPQLYAPVGGGSDQSQNYWVDLEVQAGPLALGSGLLMTGIA